LTGHNARGASAIELGFGKENASAVIKALEKGSGRRSEGTRREPAHAFEATSKEGVLITSAAGTENPTDAPWRFPSGRA
jgi:hypothetical protein